MGRAAIIVPAISGWVEEGRELARAVVDAEQTCTNLEQKLTTTREAARARRIELGRFLAGVKDKVKHGEWGEFLEAIEVSRTSAFRHMQEAGVTLAPAEVEQMATQASGTTGPSFVPPPRDEDAPREADDGATDADEVEVDRNTWCTPKWITNALGKVDLDPCANERSHVQAGTSFDLERRGEDGLVCAAGVSKRWRVFINPPYDDVPTWLAAYKHTRFIFLLKLDPSTKWFKELFGLTELILIPIGTRVQFEPPPGVPADQSKAQPFPHALFFAHAEDATPELLERCFQWRVEHS